MIIFKNTLSFLKMLVQKNKKQNYKSIIQYAL